MAIENFLSFSGGYIENGKYIQTGVLICLLYQFKFIKNLFYHLQTLFLTMACDK